MGTSMLGGRRSRLLQGGQSKRHGGPSGLRFPGACQTYVAVNVCIVGRWRRRGLRMCGVRRSRILPAVPVCAVFSSVSGEDEWSANCGVFCNNVPMFMRCLCCEAGENRGRGKLQHLFHQVLAAAEALFWIAIA